MDRGTASEPKLIIPSLPSECFEAGGDETEELMPAIRRVIAYSGLSYTEALDLPTDVFMLMKKHSIVDEYMATPEGREHLEKCERLKITDPDVAAAKRSGFMRE